MTNLLPLLVILLPILTLPACFFYFDVTPKVAVILGGGAAVCGLAAARWAGFQSLWASRAGRRIVWLIGLQTVALAVATVVSTDAALSFTGSNWRRYGFVTQLAVLAVTVGTAAAAATGRLAMVWVERAAAGTAVAISIYAVCQYLGWDPLLPGAAYHVGEGEWTIVRPPGTIGHADYLGCYLVFSAFLGGAAWARSGAAAWRILGAACFVLCGFAIVLSGTRSAILGFGLGVALLAAAGKVNWRRMAAAAVVGALVLGIFYFSPLGLKLRGRTRWYKEDPAGGARLLLWRDSVRMMLGGRALTGWGLETFSREFPKFQSVELAQAYPDFYHESPHNAVLDELVSKGVLGAAAHVAWLTAAAMAAWRALRRAEDRGLGAAFLAGVAALQFNAFVLTTAFFFFVTAALLLGAEARVESGEDVAAGRAPGWANALAGACALLFLGFGVRLCAADAMMASVKRSLEAGDVPQAAASYERSRAWQPPGTTSDLYYSRAIWANVRRQRDLMRGVKAWQEAIQAGIRATETAEDPHNAYYHLATLYGQMNNARDTEAALRGAARCAPNWFKPHWMLAQVLAARGAGAEARDEAATALTLDGGKHAEVLETWRRVGGK